MVMVVKVVGIDLIKLFHNLKFEKSAVILTGYMAIAGYFLGNFDMKIQGGRDPLPGYLDHTYRGAVSLLYSIKTLPFTRIRPTRRFYYFWSWRILCGLHKSWQAVLAKRMHGKLCGALFSSQTPPPMHCSGLCRKTYRVF